MAKIVFLYPKKAKLHGLQQDAALVEDCLNMPVRHVDPLEPPIACDVAFHFEVPIYGWMPWATTNIFIVNPEWWEKEWNPYLKRVNVLVFKGQADKDRFVELYRDDIPAHVLILVIPWTSPVKTNDFTRFPDVNETGCLWMLGASMHKREAAKKIIPLWKESWPTLHVYTKEDLGIDVPLNVRLVTTDLETSAIRKLQSTYPCHLIFSESESLSLIAHEGRAAGAFLLGNALPTYKECFSDKGCFLTRAVLTLHKAGMKDTFEGIAQSLEEGVNAYLLADADRLSVRRSQQEASVKRWRSFKESILNLKPLLVAGSIPVLPPVRRDLPSISIVTLLYNRRKFVDLALHNLISTDYPKDKIEWVVVEDSDIQEEQASDKIIKFGRQAAPMSVSYIPLEKKTPIGKKRNIAIERAQNDIILMMDDDDHYPVTSFRRRVAWLLEHPWQPKACVCTTIACYDLIKGVSAVNSPPFTLPLKQRVSEATLTFKKSWWVAQGFPEEQIAEGEGFLNGREDEVLELPPQQIIVAMTHGSNASSRRVPEGKISCFWGFPPEFLKFLHGLAGVEVEAEADADAGAVTDLD